jgi:hypothetical protein
MGALMSTAHNAVRVGHLALKLPRAALATGAQALIEESLELCAAEFGAQHLVIRHLNLGRLQLASGVTRQRMHAAVRDAVYAAARLALPASASSAHQADAVVFSSTLEARAQLACQLLVEPSAPTQWYWPRAVPDWHPGMGAQPLLAALTRSAEGRVALAKAMSARATVPLVRAQGQGFATLAFTEDEALKLLALWPGLSSPGALQSAAPGSAVALWLDVQDLLARAPYLAAEPVEVQRQLASKRTFSRQDAEAVNAPIATSPISAPPRAQEAPRLALAPKMHTAEHARERGDAPLRHNPAEPSARDEPFAHAEDTHLVPRNPAPVMLSPQIPWTTVQDEVFSLFAGLFLLIQPLRFLGFESWLTRHPAHAAAGFGWQLLAHIADRQKLPAKDGVRACLWLGTDDKADSLALHAWCAALKGLLRRRTGHTLAAVVKRRGWITRSDGGLSVRFGQNGAEIGLRRMRFDLDPQFVPWLGLHIAYRYEDRLGS